MTWTKGDIGLSIQCDLSALDEFLGEWGTITEDGGVLTAYNLYLSGAENCPSLLTLYSIGSAGYMTEVCRDFDEIEIVDVLPDEEIVVFRSAIDDRPAFSLSFSEADAIYDED